MVMDLFMIFLTLSSRRPFTQCVSVKHNKPAKRQQQQRNDK
jgi:hypothetical protein